MIQPLQLIIILIVLSVIAIVIYRHHRMISDPGYHCWKMVSEHLNTYRNEHHRLKILPLGQPEVVIHKVHRIVLLQTHGANKTIEERFDPEDRLFKDIRSQLNSNKYHLLPDHELFVELMETAIYCFNVHPEYKLTISDFFDRLYEEFKDQMDSIEHV